VIFCAGPAAASSRALAALMREPVLAAPAGTHPSPALAQLPQHAAARRT